MLCEKCKKNQAVSKLEHKINGKVTEMVLCKTCLNKIYDTAIKSVGVPIDKSSAVDTPTASMFFDIGIPSQAFAAFVGDIMGIQTTQPAIEKICCKNCGTDIREFRKTLFVGCPDCYTAFASSMIPILKQLQGVCVHKSTENKAFATAQDTLIRELERAISEEKYEEAAILSVKLRKLREGNNLT